MCTLFHPSMKHFHIAPHEQNKALELMKKELLKRASVFADSTVSHLIQHHLLLQTAYYLVVLINRNQ